MGKKTFIPVAEYVRMSTEDQHYSIANQQAAIRGYCATNGFQNTLPLVDPSLERQSTVRMWFR